MKMEKSCGNVFRDLGFADEDAEAMKAAMDNFLRGEVSEPVNDRARRLLALIQEGLDDDAEMLKDLANR